MYRCVTDEGGCGSQMDIIKNILEAGITMIFLVVVIGLLAGLFMIVFGIATGIDDNLQG